jgi:hypothetical protein
MTDGLAGEPLLDAIEEPGIDDRRKSGAVTAVLVRNLAEVGAVAEEIEEGPAIDDEPPWSARRR